MRVNLISHSSNTYGYGHLSRAKTLQEQFLTINCETSLTVIDSKSDLKNLISPPFKNADISIFDLDPRFWELEINQLKDSLYEAAKFRKTIVMIFDTPDFTVRQLVNSFAENIFYLNPYQSHTSVKELDTLSGLSLFPMSSELIGTRDKNIDYSKKHQISVTCGGSDPHGISLLYIDLLSLFDKQILEIAVAIGPLFAPEYVQLLTNSANFSPHNIRFVKQDNFFEQIFQESFLVLTTGGLTRYELAFCGVPFVTINFDPIQDSTSEMFSREGASFHLGNVQSEIETLKLRFLETFVELWLDKLRQRQMSKNGKKFFRSNNFSVASMMVDFLHHGKEPNS